MMQCHHYHHHQTITVKYFMAEVQMLFSVDIIIVLKDNLLQLTKISHTLVQKNRDVLWNESSVTLKEYLS